MTLWAFSSVPVEMTVERTAFKGNFLDNPSGDAAICALIFWTTEAVEQFCHRHPHRHSQRAQSVR
jgi:hypothetical protein